LERTIRMGAITSFRLYFIPRTASHPCILGEQHGQSEKERSGAQLIHRCRRQVAKAAFEGKNARTENRKGYEKVRRVFEAEGLEARDWPWPSAMSAVLGSRAVFSTKQPLLPRRPPARVAVSRTTAKDRLSARLLGLAKPASFRPRCRPLQSIEHGGSMPSFSGSVMSWTSSSLTAFRYHGIHAKVKRTSPIFNLKALASLWPSTCVHVRFLYPRTGICDAPSSATGCCLDS